MTIYDLIDDDTRDKLNAVHRPKKNKEKVSDREWREVTGMNLDRYHKVNGEVVKWILH